MNKYLVYLGLFLIIVSGCYLRLKYIPGFSSVLLGVIHDICLLFGALLVGIHYRAVGWSFTKTIAVGAVSLLLSALFVHCLIDLKILIF